MATTKDLHCVSNCWETPQCLFDDLNKEFDFDADLCATEDNSKCYSYCKDYLTEIIGGVFDGSKQTFFMNPPYSNPKPFIEKAWEDSKHCKIVCLVKCDPSTRWWATFWNYEKVFIRELDEDTDEFYIFDILLPGPKPGCEVRFFPKRIKFDPPKGWKGMQSGPSFASALVIMDRGGL